MVVSNIFTFHPYLAKWSNLTNSFFKWVETTTSKLRDECDLNGRDEWRDHWIYSITLMFLSHHILVLNTTSLTMTMQALQTPAIILEKSIFWVFCLISWRNFLLRLLWTLVWSLWYFSSSPSSVGMIASVKGFSDAELIGDRVRGVTGRGWSHFGTRSRIPSLSLKNGDFREIMYCKLK